MTFWRYKVKISKMPYDGKLSLIEKLNEGS